MSFRFGFAGVIVASFALGSGCVLVRANRNVKTLDQIATVKGDLSAQLPDGKPAFVVLLRDGGHGWEIQSSRLLYTPGPFVFLTRPGTVSVYAFADTNGDSQWNPGEPSVALEQRTLADGESSDVGSITLDAAASPAPLTEMNLSAGSVTEELVKVHRGDICTLDEERFHEDSANLGFWQPADFALKYGVGISFLEPYDPRRTPVIFVHGAAGTPAHFATVIAGLDRTRYQPWVYSYPSGIRIELAATTLMRIMDDLKLKLGFKRALVVAHSMGGLVARGYVGRVAARDGDASYVRMLVTISTPFGGHESAQTGVDHAPVVLPCWLDMAAGSPYLRSLRPPLPSSIPHHVFFSFIGGSGSGGPTDGTVSMRSMLAPGVQESASLVRGFPEDHMSILKSPTMIEALNASLGLAAP